MPVWQSNPRILVATLLAASLLGLAAEPIQAQESVALGRPVPNCCRPSPCVTGEGTPVTSPSGEPAIPPSTFVTPGDREVAESQFAYGTPMLGDFLAPSGGIRTVMFGPNG